MTRRDVTAYFLVPAALGLLYGAIAECDLSIMIGLAGVVVASMLAR